MASRANTGAHLAISRHRNELLIKNAHQRRITEANPQCVLRIRQRTSSDAATRNMSSPIGVQIRWLYIIPLLLLLPPAFLLVKPRLAIFKLYRQSRIKTGRIFTSVFRSYNVFKRLFFQAKSGILAISLLNLDSTEFEKYECVSKEPVTIRR
jgi:hypothetical protein